MPERALQERQLDLDRVLTPVRLVGDNDARQARSVASASRSTGTSPSGVRNAPTPRGTAMPRNAT